MPYYEEPTDVTYASAAERRRWSEDYMLDLVIDPFDVLQQKQAQERQAKLEQAQRPLSSLVAARTFEV